MIPAGHKIVSEYQKLMDQMKVKGVAAGVLKHSSVFEYGLGVAFDVSSDGVKQTIIDIAERGHCPVWSSPCSYLLCVGDENGNPIDGFGCTDLLVIGSNGMAKSKLDLPQNQVE